MLCFTGDTSPRRFAIILHRGVVAVTRTDGIVTTIRSRRNQIRIAAPVRGCVFSSQPTSSISETKWRNCPFSFFFFFFFFLEALSFSIRSLHVISRIRGVGVINWRKFISSFCVRVGATSLHSLSRASFVVRFTLVSRFFSSILRQSSSFFFFVVLHLYKEIYKLIIARGKRSRGVALFSQVSRGCEESVFFSFFKGNRLCDAKNDEGANFE